MAFAAVASITMQLILSGTVALACSAFNPCAREQYRHYVLPLQAHFHRSVADICRLVRRITPSLTAADDDGTVRASTRIETKAVRGTNGC